jgi:hypothetical protein
MTLSPMPVSHPFTVHNLVLRGKKIDVTLTGNGNQAYYTLNGKKYTSDFISWDALDMKNSLVIEMKDDV